MDQTKHSEESRMLADAVRACRPLVPSILGLMAARTALIVSTYGGYSETDYGIYTDGSSLIALAFFAVILLCPKALDTRLPKRIIHRIACAAIIVQAISVAAMGFISPAMEGLGAASLALSTIATISSWTAIAFWLRRARGCASAVAVLLSFGALAASEPVIYLATFLPESAACTAAGLLALAQFACMKRARAHILPADIAIDGGSLGYYSRFAHTMTDSVRFMAATAGGMFIISIAIGYLRGFPDGEPVAFTPLPRIGYMVLTMALFVVLIRNSFLNKSNTMAVIIWVIMQATGAASLLAYAAFPESLDIGAMFATVLNATMTGFMWYLVIVFSSYGKRDPYYYAIGGWMAFMLPRSIARVTTLGFDAQFGDVAMLTAVIGVLLLVSAQFVFLQFLWLSGKDDSPNSAHKPAPAAISKLLGLDEAVDPAEARRALMRHHAEEIQAQFLLSDREAEVLALYAMGLTQSKIADELCISAGTAHTHIKRIYAKTNFHSRQDILDYIEQYAEH